MSSFNSTSTKMNKYIDLNYFDKINKEIENSIDKEIINKISNQMSEKIINDTFNRIKNSLITDAKNMFSYTNGEDMKNNQYNRWGKYQKYIKWILDNFNNFDWKVLSYKKIKCEYKEIIIEINDRDIFIYSKHNECYNSENLKKISYETFLYVYNYVRGYDPEQEIIFKYISDIYNKLINIKDEFITNKRKINVDDLLNEYMTAKKGE